MKLSELVGSFVKSAAQGPNRLRGPLKLRHSSELGHESVRLVKIYNIENQKFLFFNLNLY